MSMCLGISDEECGLLQHSTVYYISTANLRSADKSVPTEGNDKPVMPGSKNALAAKASTLPQGF